MMILHHILHAIITNLQTFQVNYLYICFIILNKIFYLGKFFYLKFLKFFMVF